MENLIILAIAALAVVSYLLLRIYSNKYNPKIGSRTIKSYDISNAVITKRREPIRPNELLYDHEGHPVAIKSNGKILPIFEGDL